MGGGCGERGLWAVSQPPDGVNGPRLLLQRCAKDSVGRDVFVRFSEPERRREIDRERARPFGEHLMLIVGDPNAAETSLEAEQVIDDIGRAIYQARMLPPKHVQERTRDPVDATSRLMRGDRSRARGATASLG
jgi:hypothetical protein